MRLTPLDDELRLLTPGVHGHYRYTAVYRVEDRFTVRVRVRLDGYSHQSYAVAEVLAGDLTWSNLVDAVPPRPPDPATAEIDHARQVAEAVLVRACDVLPPTRPRRSRG
jgi:hypothetical protein